MREQILEAQNILLGAPSESREDAIRRVGQMLVDAGFANEDYIYGMLQREKAFSTSVESGVAMPHADKQFKQNLMRSGVAAVTYPQGISWGDETVYLVFGIAASADDHLEILQKVTWNLETKEQVLALIEKNDPQAICDVLK